MKAFILAAGMGSRLKPFTDHHPKALAIVNGKTLLQHTIEYLQKYNIYDLIINVHYLGQQIIDFLNEHNGFGSKYVISSEIELLETGGALLHAQFLFQNDPALLVINVDMLTNANFNSLIQEHIKQKAAATLAIQNRVSNRLLLFLNKNQRFQLKGWKNTVTHEYKPKNIDSQYLSKFAFSGIQIINPTLLKDTKLKGKFSLIDLYLEQCNNHEIVGWEHTRDLLLDVGKPETLEQAKILFKDLK